MPCVERIRLPLAFSQSQVRPLREPVGLPISALGVASRLAHADLATDLVRAHVLLVLIDDRAAKAALQDDNRRKNKTGADLDQRNLRLTVLALGSGLGICTILRLLSGFGLADLVDSNPDLAIDTEDTDDAVNEWLHALDTTLRDTEDTAQHLSDQTPVFVAGLAHERTLFVERVIENNKTTATLEAVAAESSIQFSHCVQVGDVELDRRAIGRTSKPEVQVLTLLTSLEEENHVAGVKVGKRVKEQIVSSGLLLGVKFAFLVSVRKQRRKVGEQVSMAAANRKD